MAKRTPDRKVAQGTAVGTVVGLITTVFMLVFHKSLPVAVVTALPAILTLVSHFLGSYFAPYVPRVEEAIAWVKKLLNEIPSA